MGDLHNLFGRVNEVHVFLEDDEEDGFYIEDSIKGFTTSDVLQLTQYDGHILTRQMKKQVDRATKADHIKPREGTKILAEYGELLRGTPIWPTSCSKEGKCPKAPKSSTGATPFNDSARESTGSILSRRSPEHSTQARPLGSSSPVQEELTPFSCYAASKCFLSISKSIWQSHTTTTVGAHLLRTSTLSLSAHSRKHSNSPTSKLRALRTKPAVETTARALRLEFLRSAANDFGSDFIAFGHQLDDIIETQLQRIARGVGSEGLAAPRPVSHFADAPTHIRPFLQHRAVDIRMALNSIEIPWREGMNRTPTLISLETHFALKSSQR